MWIHVCGVTESLFFLLNYLAPNPSNLGCLVQRGKAGQAKGCVHRSSIPCNGPSDFMHANLCDCLVVGKKANKPCGICMLTLCSLSTPDPKSQSFIGGWGWGGKCSNSGKMNWDQCIEYHLLFFLAHSFAFMVRWSWRWRWRVKIGQFNITYIPVHLFSFSCIAREMHCFSFCFEGIWVVCLDYILCINSNNKACAANSIKVRLGCFFFAWLKRRNHLNWNTYKASVISEWIWVA